MPLRNREAFLQTLDWNFYNPGKFKSFESKQRNLSFQ